MATRSSPEPPAEPSPGSGNRDGLPGDAASRRRGPRWLVIGVIAALVVAAGAVGVAVAGGDEAAGGCLPSLGSPTHGDGLLTGSDLERARSMADEPPGRWWEDTPEFFAATGAGVDPVSLRAASDLFGEDPSAYLGYNWTDVDCWIEVSTRVLIRGSFDEDRIVAAEGLALADEIRLDGDVLTYIQDHDEDVATGEEEVPPQVTELLEVVYRNDIVSFWALAGTREGSDPDAVWTTLGTAQGEGLDLLMVWTFPSEDEAVAGEPELRRVLGGESAVGDLMEGDPAGQLERAGSSLVLRAPLTGDAAWRSQLMVGQDPAFELFSDLPGPPGDDGHQRTGSCCEAQRRDLPGEPTTANQERVPVRAAAERP